MENKYLSVVRLRGFRVGFKGGRAPVLMLGWWWFCWGSAADRRADVDDLDREGRRHDRMLRQIPRIHTDYRPRRRG